MAIYLQYEDIKGNVTAEGYQDHIALQTVNFGVSRRVSMEPGNISNREFNHPVLSEISLNKTIDRSGGIYTQCGSGAETEFSRGWWGKSGRESKPGTDKIGL
ncbi:type VI secretion system tube protein Hcp [Beggiatoa alba]|nr:type VI secretion system tube protein Hcp [Beggiatoa alba]